jgi:hypothetical protein
MLTFYLGTLTCFQKFVLRFLNLQGPSNRVKCDQIHIIYQKTDFPGRINPDIELDRCIRSQKIP